MTREEQIQQRSLIETELYAGYEGLSIEGFLHKRSIACQMDEYGTIISATAEFARVMGFSSHRDLRGKSIIAVVRDSTEAHQWLPWVTEESAEAIAADIFKTAQEIGVVHKTLNIVTPDMMIYRAVVELDWIPTSQTYFLRGNHYDPYTASKVGGRTGPICIGAKGNVRTNRGSTYTQEDLVIIKQYLAAKSVEAMAEDLGITPKSLEYKLRGIAENYHFTSMGALVKHFAENFVNTLPSPENTLCAKANHPLFSRWRYELLPDRFLPTVRGYMSSAVKRVMPENTKAVDGLKAKLAKFKKPKEAV